MEDIGRVKDQYTHSTGASDVLPNQAIQILSFNVLKTFAFKEAKVDRYMNNELAKTTKKSGLSHRVRTVEVRKLLGTVTNK